jgi:predicted DNA-binding transcriptional regulator AlpA
MTSISAEERPKLRKVVRFPEIESYTGLSRSQIEVKIAAGQFPQPFKITDTGRSIGWFEGDIIRWQLEREKAAKRKAR